ncbi:CBS domain-containing protein [Thauera mechernichensis]|uniref:CBS domain-containing protein n=2 Tax=Thauera TaxID=33057 RepID=A0ABW3WKB5_9RHOO|nr:MULTISPECIES: CBS domain-containing protein [Thauera]ENO90838.1 signal transduction protein [Thauera sp. 28]MDG3063471.1 CBS domain-containing protein [Thauera mechernichensis]WBL63455.1 CBS domain-containing protein [Thauera sp. WB-2]
MLVKDIMLREVVTVSPFATIREAMRVMKQNKVKSLVVEKRDAHDAYGIITYTNILKTIVAEEGDIDLVNVYDICAKPALTISRELDVKHAARLMVNIGVRRLLVTSSNELAGIVTMSDIVGAILKLADEEA